MTEPIPQDATPIGTPPLVQHGGHSAVCNQCGYSLVGLPTAGNCPECGTSVAESLRGWQLAFTSRAYLRALSRGLLLVTIGMALQVFLIPAGFLIGNGFWMDGGNGTVRLLLIAGEIFVGVGVLIGYWQLAASDPNFPELDLNQSSRRVIRAAVYVSAATLALRTAGPLYDNLHGYGIDVMSLLGRIVGGAVALIPPVVLFFATLRYTQLIGQRVPDAVLVRRSQTYAWLLPVVMFIGPYLILVMYILLRWYDSEPAWLLILLASPSPLVAVAMYIMLLWRLRQHVQSILANGSPAVLRGMA